jgi:hypothetical protein
VAETGNGDVGILRIEFPGHGSDEKLTDISWDEFSVNLKKGALLFSTRTGLRMVSSAVSLNLSLGISPRSYLRAAIGIVQRLPQKLF